jgi:hypothetical protein
MSDAKTAMHSALEPDQGIRVAVWRNISLNEWLPKVGIIMVEKLTY